MSFIQKGAKKHGSKIIALLVSYNTFELQFFLTISSNSQIQFNPKDNIKSNNLKLYQFPTEICKSSVFLQNMFPLRIFTASSLCFLVHFAEASTYERNRAGIHHNDTINESHVNTRKTFDIVIHGIILWASMGFLMPLGILTMRMSSTRECNLRRHKIFFYLHAIFQVLAVVLVTIGAVLSIRNFENAFDNIHQRIGLALYASMYMQILVGCRRPNRGTRGRRAWYFLHWILGTTMTLVGIFNIYTGLQAYHRKTSKSTSLWTIIFTTQISFMAIFYLFQDKWEYMQKQGIIVHAGVGAPDNDISSTGDHLESQKDFLSDPSRKSNALGAYFSRTNALNKLFQVT